MSKILVVGILSTAMASAQGGGWGHRSEDPSGGMLAQRQGQLDQFADKLKLNKQQRAEAETILDAAREAMAPIQQKLLEARKNLAAALIDGQPDDAVDQLTKTYTSLAAQSKALEAKAFAKICALLKPNQQSRAVQNFGLMAQLLEQGQMGGQWGGGQGGPWSGGRGGGGRR
ncbi:MAG TPA: periplasmic heavy metal sensor [Bryobacteraceae bacterium]